MPDTRKLIVWFSFALIASIALDALAQFPGGGRGGRAGGSRQQGGMPRGETPATPSDIANLLEFRLESMQDDLKLSPNQNRLFDGYADKVRSLGEDFVRERDRARVQAHSATQLTAPQQMDHVLDVARNRMTALEDIAASAKTLYESLTTEQKLLADSRVATLVPLLTGTAGNSGVPEPRRGGPPAGGRDAGPPR